MKTGQDFVQISLLAFFQKTERILKLRPLGGVWYDTTVFPMERSERV